MLTSTSRSYAVSYVRHYPKHYRLPAIMFRGQWLVNVSFEPERKLEVRVMDECIVITPKNLQP
jgi:toxic protein SymE